MRLFGREYSYPELLLGGLIVTLCVATLFAASTSAASFGVYNAGWNGASGLQSLTEESDTTTEIGLNTSAYEETPANATAFILSPDSGYSPQERTHVNSFVRNGGTLVVAEDYGPHSNRLLRSIGVSARFDGRVLRDERENYRSPAMPVATGVNETPMTEDVDQLTLNYGTVITANNSTVVARSSQFSYLDTTPNGELDDNETLSQYPVVVTEQVGDGRVILVSDPSLFINSMLERPGNQQFSQNLISDTEYVLFDYSQTEQQPPLAVALLTLRESTFLQVLVGLLSFGAITAVFSSNPKARRFRQILSPLRRND
ncbi:hypothetical protein AUR64_14570 [Haloprofundus marisrubri]|uniref:DUF4350 domain-containing protein n=1 Tax=Haloprofundus marisrubri TaxID=1514971 RepID=A0A0W1R6V3_9EURY|nr:DUF4350 domain-containing protein [Haloprofundus marisrubri]KTG09023.1 hypothetical protein AUR64_14570 [Haloprofundus marisrubri]